MRFHGSALTRQLAPQQIFPAILFRFHLNIGKELPYANVER